MKSNGPVRFGKISERIDRHCRDPVHIGYAWGLDGMGSGCAEVEPYSYAPETGAADSHRWFARLDEALDRAGVRDGGALPDTRLPYLRADRYSASFRHQGENDQIAFTEWVDRYRAMDATAPGIRAA